MPQTPRTVQWHGGRGLELVGKAKIPEESSQAHTASSWVEMLPGLRGCHWCWSCPKPGRMAARYSTQGRDMEENVAEVLNLHLQDAK